MTANKKTPAPRKKVAAKPAAKSADLAALEIRVDQLMAANMELLDLVRQLHADKLAPQPLQTGAENAAARLDALLSIFSGKGAQQALEDMLASGVPSRNELLRVADAFIARSGK